MKSNRWTAKDIAEENARNRDAIENMTAQLATLKEENERLKEENKLANYSADLADTCREEWKKTAVEFSEEVKTLKARVAELDGTLIKKIRVVMANVRNISRPKTTPNWNLYMHLFGCGSTSAIRGCQKIGLDPYGCKSGLNASIKEPANEG